jgi:hypothetical protein
MKRVLVAVMIVLTIGSMTFAQEAVAPGRILEALREIDGIESNEEKAVALTRYIAVLSAQLGASSKESAPETSSTETTSGFRGVSWGASEAAVIESEGEPDRTSGGSLVYPVRVSGLDAIAFFDFIDGMLVSGGYSIVEEHSNPNRYVSQYRDLKSRLIGLYGEPDIDSESIDRLYRSDRERWGLAISSGRGSFLTSWELSHTRVSMLLMGNNYEISTHIVYDSVEHRDLIESTRSETQTEGL